MENPNFFRAALGSKRKCEDSEVVLELLNGVSLSPHVKKPRQEFGSTCYSNPVMDAGAFDTACSDAYPTADVELAEGLPNDFQLCPPEIDLIEQPLEALPSPPTNDERAIVLYKPVNPPLFPGGPRSGSQLMLNANILSSGALDSSNLLRGRNDRELSWLKAPRNGVRIMEITEDEDKQLDTSHGSHLAVVPWVPKSFRNVAVAQPLGVAQPLVQSANQDFDNMCGENLGVEAMEEDSELSLDFVNSQPGNSNTSFCYKPWQQYGAPQRQYRSVLWSC